MRIQDTGHSIPRGHRSSLSKEQSFEAGTPNLQYDEGAYGGGGGLEQVRCQKGMRSTKEGQVPGSGTL